MFVCGAFKKRGCVSLPPGIFPLSLVWQLVSTPVMLKPTEPKVLVQLLPEEHSCNRHKCSYKLKFKSCRWGEHRGNERRRGSRFLDFFCTRSVDSSTQHSVPYTLMQKSENGWKIMKIWTVTVLKVWINWKSRTDMRKFWSLWQFQSLKGVSMRMYKGLGLKMSGYEDISNWPPS